MLEHLKENFTILMGVGGMFASYLIGRERTRARIREVSAELAEVRNDIRTLTGTVTALSTKLASVDTNIEWLKKHAGGK